MLEVFMCRKPWNFSISEKYSKALNVLIHIFERPFSIGQYHIAYFVARFRVSSLSVNLNKEHSFRAFGRPMYFCKKLSLLKKF